MRRRRTLEGLDLSVRVCGRLVRPQPQAALLYLGLGGGERMSTVLKNQLDAKSGRRPRLSRVYSGVLASGQ